ncbi:MAG: TetR/AcrR family transcriptional regulator [Ilumatobacter sp.]|nr:TetR/AcrR family transcriptional regulator [Ilumatobacter sp.]
MAEQAAQRTDDGARAPNRRRGRPPATDSADTRRKIFDVARCLFAERGYGAVTNKDVASAAGITPGALYHYVESKLDLYVQVDVDMQRTIYFRFQDALASSGTFIGKFSAMLEAAYELAEEDPAVASFVGAVRTDMRRHPEVAERLARYAQERDQFFVDIVDIGVATGEIAPQDKPLAIAFVRTVLIGLTETVSTTPGQHRDAIDAVIKLLRGTLLRAPSAVD